MARARLLARTLAAVLVAFLALGLVEGVPSPAVAAPHWANFNYFTLNVRYNNNASQTQADIAKAMGTGDVGGFQEFSESGDQAALASYANSHGWGIFLPHNGGGGAIPIVWKESRFAQVSAASTQVHPAVYRTNPDGSRGAMASPPRFINTVVLTDKLTGKQVAFINTHTISQASYDAQASDPVLVPYLRQHFAMLRQTIQTMAAQTDAVVVGGDFNVNYLADRRRQVDGFPTKMFGGLMSFNMPNTGSHGAGSLLDYNMSLKYGSLEPSNGHIVYGYNSDHDSVVVTYGEINYFAAQTVKNTMADPVSKGLVLNRMTRALQNAPAGAAVTLMSRRVGNPVLTGAVAAARARGVNVAVLRNKKTRGAVMTVNGVEGMHNVTMTSSRPGDWSLYNRPTSMGISNRPRVYNKAVKAFNKAARHHR